MKRFKWILILSILMTFIFSNIIVFAENDDNIQIDMNGEALSARRVSVLLDGQALETTVPSFIHSDRTLVHLRFVENYGAEVSWEQSSKTATVTYEDTIVKLSINSPLASINDESFVLDKNSIPRLITFPEDDNNAWTMIPFRFVSEILGYEVGYNEDNKLPYINSKQEVEEPIEDPDDLDSFATITNIYKDKGSTDKQKVVIKSDGKIHYASQVLPGTNKLVIDIDNAILDISGQGDRSGSISVNDGAIIKVDYSQYSYGPDVVRLVITMTDRLEYDIVPSEDEKTNVVSFVNKIDDFIIEEIDDKNLLLIKGNDIIDYNIMKLENPKRIVIDIMDASLSYGTYHEFPYDLGFIKGVRVSQFLADNNYSSLDRIVRVVLDIKDGVLEPLIKIDNVGNDLIIYPGKSLWEDISYEIDGKDRYLTINNENLTQYTIENYPQLKTLELVIPSDLSKLEDGHVFVKDGLIEEIEVIKDKRNTLIKVRYNKSIIFDILSQETDENIVLKINRNLDVKPSERVIVIDPGHGGEDPGAISVTGRHEKDLNFSVANKVNQGLVERGYNVLMTRDTDTNIDLYERARIANENYADLFVSIHGNSYPSNRDINGLEVYYMPQNKSFIKIEEQYPFAKSIHDEIIKASGSTTRGIKTNSFVVIRETRMSAVLIETGFLSNAGEESLLYSEEYQNKLAEGIIKGIESYLEIY